MTIVYNFADKNRSKMMFQKRENPKSTKSEIEDIAASETFLESLQIYDSTSPILESISHRRYSDGFDILDIQVCTISVYKRLVSELEALYPLRQRRMTDSVVGFTGDVSFLCIRLKSRNRDDFESAFNILKLLEPTIIAIESEFFSHIRLTKQSIEKSLARQVSFKLPELNSEDLSKRPFDLPSRHNLFKERCFIERGYDYDSDIEDEISPSYFSTTYLYRKEYQDTQSFFRKKQHLGNVNNIESELSQECPSKEKTGNMKVRFKC